jgi:hypothetical protein
MWPRCGRKDAETTRGEEQAALGARAKLDTAYPHSLAHEKAGESIPGSNFETKLLERPTQRELNQAWITG